MSDAWISDDELKKILDEEEPEPKAEEGIDGILDTLSKDDEDGVFYEETMKDVEIKNLNLEELMESVSPNQADRKSSEVDFKSLYDVPLEVKVLLGSVEKTIEDILNMDVDSVLKLSKMAGEPVEIIVGEQIVAKGETVIIDDRFGVLITDIIPPRERIRTVEKKLRKKLIFIT